MEDLPIENARPLAPLSLSERIEVLRSKPEFKMVLAIIAIVLIFGYLIGSKLINSASEDAITISNVVTTATEKEVETLSVYVTGEVASPGVYELDKNSRIIDAIERAGNVNGQADLGDCNLAQKLNDGLMIRVPLRGESEIQSCTDTRSEILPSSQGGQTSSVSKVNLNSATQAELETLPGVGPATAISIISHRQNEAFKSINDLRKVKGIGEKRFAELKDLVDV